MATHVRPRLLSDYLVANGRPIIGLAEAAEFEQRRQRDRRELAERFAYQQQSRSAAIDELADLL